ncbi:DNA-binding MarR family transcriptional regulator [Naumannella cuiyingiana]|uniref:DNA-binding MarR family transcriptional regulator n=1 Tax=Naumannella cuiyingiana TaxID=1347891 RepID=A0A7Z0DB32_9ACTN|nr:MarR family transcriptional regulator [Naumannella cuiyingiana]NYI72054.1 DNA-binding MarR family transcriptional regulator [Naumannella cuiyingiana]
MSSAEPDSVDRELDEWLAEMPEVAPQVEAARQRIGRLSRLFGRTVELVAREAGLSVGDLEALSAIVRSGGTITPTALGSALGLTSGTVSTRIARLSAEGFVALAGAAGDGRSRPIVITAVGRRRWRTATAARVRVEADLFDALDAEECRTLNDLLRTLLARYESDLGEAERHDIVRPGR